MDQGVIASVPLGLIVIAALVLLTLGGVIGWGSARARIHKKAEHAVSDQRSRVSIVLGALPQAAITIDNEAIITANNTLATKLMNELNWSINLPTALDAAVGRVIRSDVSETMEIATQSKPTHRVQITITPLHVAGQHAEALVLFNTLSTGSNRAEVYQRLMGSMAHELRTPLPP